MRMLLLCLFLAPLVSAAAVTMVPAAPAAHATNVLRTHYARGRAVGHTMETRDLSIETDPVSGIARVVFDDLAGVGQSIFGSSGDVPDDAFDIPILDVAGADLLELRVFIDMSAEVWFNPCEETVGAAINFAGPITLVPVVFDIEVFGQSLAIDVESASIEVDVSDLGKSWPLPPVFDKITGFEIQDEYCVEIALPEVPFVGDTDALRVCLSLGNFTILPSGISACPQITVHAGDVKLLDVTFADASEILEQFSTDKRVLDGLCIEETGCRCLGLGYTPLCLFGDLETSPSIVESFRSLDPNNDFLVSFEEYVSGQALAGNFRPESEHRRNYNSIDEDDSDSVDIVEYNAYANRQLEKYESEPYAAESYSAGTLAGSIVGGIIGGALLIVGVAFLVEKARPGSITSRLNRTPQALQNL